MPGYLTHAMILIKTDEVLAGVIEDLERLHRKLRAERKCLSPFEARVLRLARTARRYLRPPPELKLPRTEIHDAFDEKKPGVGDGLSKYAFVGSIGPDLPEAGYIFAINQRWAANTMHGGGTRRSYLVPGTNDFVLAFLDEIRKPGTPPERRHAMLSYLVGHVSHVAADVVLNPFFHHRVWDHGGDDPGLMKRHQLELELDARVARGFFGRRDLYDGGSWTDYYLDRGEFEEQVDELLKTYRAAFVAAHGGDVPEGGLCAAESATCAPKLDEKFLADAYGNITGWALDAGYDHSPAPYYVVGSIILLGAYVWLYKSLVSTTDDFETFGNGVFEWNEEQNDAVAAEVQAAWQTNGFPGNERAWSDAIGTSLLVSDLPFMGLATLLNGGAPEWLSKLPVIGVIGAALHTGIFGQGKLDRPLVKTLGSIGLLLKTLTFFVLNEAMPQELQKAGWRWSKLGIDLGGDLWDYLHLTTTTLEDGGQGDPLPRALWPVKRGLTLLFLGGAVIIFLIRSVQRNADGSRVTGWRLADFFAGLVMPLTAILILCSGVVIDFILREAARLALPRPATPNIARYLPEWPAGGERVSWSAADAGTFPVRLFPETAIQVSEESEARIYPEDTALEYWDEERARNDEAQRRTKSVKSARDDYTLLGLFDDAARLSAVLAMASVAYDEAGPAVRKQVEGIFHDWNLDYRTVAEWDALMNREPGPGIGLLGALERWLDGVKALAPTADANIIGPLEQGLGAAATTAAGEIHADFGHQGLPIEAVAGRCTRLDRPGAILLANLDMDGPIAPPSAPPDSRELLVDALRDDVINAPEDADELASLRVIRPPAGAAGFDLALRIHPGDATRVRIFEVGAGAPDTWPRRIGAGAAGGAAEYAIPAGMSGSAVDFKVEALTLPGDPRLSAPTGPAPAPPAPYDPADLPPGLPIVASRAPADVWVELVHRDGAADVPDIRDAALLTIAPWLLVPNVQPTERVYVTYRKGASGNHPTVADLVDALEAALGKPRIRVTRTALPGGGVEFTPHRPVPPGDAEAADALYLVDWDIYEDVWVQDEFEIGYCDAPHARMPVVVHVPRAKDVKLGKFALAELPGKDLGFFNGVGESAKDAVDFGGNLEVSMPVGRETPALPAGAAGPAVAQQRAAPLGKMLLGEGEVLLFELPLSHVAELDAHSIGAPLIAAFDAANVALSPLESVEVVTAGSEWILGLLGHPVHCIRKKGSKLEVYAVRPVKADYKRFLEAQAVQPILPLDTSWLHVGHVDEFLSIIPAKSGGKAYRMLVASTSLCVRLLKEAQAHHDADPAARPLTDMFRGREWAALPAALTAPPAVPPSTSSARISVKDALDKLTECNEKIQTHRLTPIEERLKQGLDLGEADIVHTPVLFDLLPPALAPRYGAAVTVAGVPVVLRTSAFTPAMVNLLVVDDHLMIPRPFGPRMKPADVTTVLSRVGVSVPPGMLDPLVDHSPWARQGDNVHAIAAIYGVDPAAVRSHADNAGKFDALGNVTANWTRIRIPEGNVDLLEAYTVATLQPLGLTVHFIDDWDHYHRKHGEVHCGTNALRTMPPAMPGYTGPRWWEIV